MWKDGDAIMKAKKTWFSIACILLIVLGFGLILYANISKSDYEEQYMANNRTIGDLRDELSVVQRQVNEWDNVNVEVVKVKVKSCAEIGQKVAELQTKYQILNPAEDEALFLENVDSLDMCFDEFSKNCRVPWYTVAVPGSVQWTWTFQSTYEFSASSTNVIWLCHENESNNLLAYATGVYNADTELFSNIVCVMTSMGADYYYADPTPGMDNDESGDSVPTEPTGEVIDGVLDSTTPSDTTEPSDGDGDVGVTTPDTAPDTPDAPDDIGGGGVADVGDRG